MTRIVKTVLVGRSSPSDGVCIKDETLDNGLRVHTWSYTYTETYVDVPEDILRKIAKHYNKKVEELSEDEIAEYLLEVEKIEDKVEGVEHYFSRDW